MIIPPDPRPILPTTPGTALDGAASDGFAFAAILDHDAAGDAKADALQPEAGVVPTPQAVPPPLPGALPPRRGEGATMPASNDFSGAEDGHGDHRIGPLLPSPEASALLPLSGTLGPIASLADAATELNAGGQGEASSTQPSPPNQDNTPGVLDRPQAATGWSLTGQVVQEQAAGGIADQPPEPPTSARSAPAQPILEGSEMAPVTVQITVFGSEAGAGDAKLDQAQSAAVGIARRAAAPGAYAADVAATQANTVSAEGRRDDTAAPADSAADRRTDGLATPPVLSSLAPSPASTGARAIIDTVAAAIPMAAAGPDRVEVILSPEELGRVQMDFRADGDNVRVFLTAERPDTLDLLRRHADQLAAELRQAGYSGASLSFGQWGQSHPQGQRTGALAQVPQGEGRAQGPASVFTAGSVPGCGLDLRI